MFGEEHLNPVYVALRASMLHWGIGLIIVSIVVFLVLCFAVPDSVKFSRKTTMWNQRKLTKVKDRYEIGKENDPQTYYRMGKGFNKTTYARPNPVYYGAMVICFIVLFAGIALCVMGPEAIGGFFAACFIHTSCVVAICLFIKNLPGYKKDKDVEDMNEEEHKRFKSKIRKQHALYWSTLIATIAIFVKCSAFLNSIQYLPK